MDFIEVIDHAHYRFLFRQSCDVKAVFDLLNRGFDEENPASLNIWQWTWYGYAPRPTPL